AVRFRGGAAEGAGCAPAIGGLRAGAMSGDRPLVGTGDSVAQAVNRAVESSIPPRKMTAGFTQSATSLLTEGSLVRDGFLGSEGGPKGTRTPLSLCPAMAYVARAKRVW